MVTKQPRWRIKFGTRSITVDGEGIAKVKPDQMTISFAIDSTATTSVQCSKLQAGKTNKVIAALKSKIGSSGTVQTLNYSLNPQMVPAPMPTPSQTSASTGDWEFSQNIEADSDSISDLAPLIDVALAAAPGVKLTGSGYHQPYPYGNARFDVHGPGVVGLGATGKPRHQVQAFVLFTVKTRGATPDQATKLGSEKVDKVKEALAHKLGKGGKVTFYAGRFWIQQAQSYPRQPPPPPREKRIYNAHTDVRVTTNRLDSLGTLIQAGLASGANQVYSVTFTLSDDSAAKKEAIAAAAEDAKSKAQTIAHTMGIKLGKVLKISTNAQLRPARLPEASIQSAVQNASRASGASIERLLTPALPHRVGVSAYLNVVYAID